MQGLILAAGMGTRLEKYTEDKPKCMVEVGNQKIIARQIEALNNSNITNIVVVVGYKKDILKKYLLDNYKNCNFSFVENNEYANTNNIYSLYLAKEHLEKDDTILLESDVVMEKTLIKRIVDSKEENTIAVSKYTNEMDGTAVEISNDGTCKRFLLKNELEGKDFDNYYKTINLYKINKKFAKEKFNPKLNKKIEENKINDYYEIVFKDLIYDENEKINVSIFNDEKWYEVDNVQDLEIADCLFSSALEKYQSRYGGYWRFKDLKDYCYLENPTFPCDNMMDKITYYAKDLITKYPSTLKVQNANAARMFEIDEKYIMVGNGSAELINVLGNMLEGKLSIRIPVFNEYIRCFKKCEINKQDTTKDNFEYNKETIIKQFENNDIIALVNPDNPSGNYIVYNDIIEILDIAKQKNKIIIFDESFIDFADGDKKYTLLKNEILDKYSNLIIIKSIGKSYGIPGLRLGIMATSNSSLLENIKKELGVWNINSLAEYFLQIINQYKDDYKESCKYIANQRNKMIERLSKIPNIKTYNSQANYLMCELKNIDSTKFTKRLLEQNNILIKDLKNKEGFEDKNYVRIAIKSEEDNNTLLSAIEENLV